MMGSQELGVQVFGCRREFLEGREETPLFSREYRMISVRLNVSLLLILLPFFNSRYFQWPGHEPFTGRIKVHDPVTGYRVTKGLLLKELARIIEKFLVC
jgi:hypothetical protein